MESEKIKVRPISPEEVAKKKIETFPDAVIESFNELIVENDDGRRDIIVKQKDAVKLMESKGLNSAEIYKRGWLNIEEMYRKANWKVGYEKPAMDEDFDAYFTFSRKRRNSSYDSCDID
ncbi:MAG: hypothetical protein WCV81_03125 [Microgenomates group bacterium]|jgi:hypothetical protein